MLKLRTDYEDGLVNVGALIITYSILGVPYYNYSVVGPKAQF